MIELNIDIDRLQVILTELRATERQVDLALRSTSLRMAGWLRARAVPDLSRILKIQQKQVRRRIKASFRRHGNGIWFGLNPVGAKWLKPRQVASGVNAEGGRHFTGAFIRKGQVYRRKTAKRMPVEIVEDPVEEKMQNYIEGSIDTQEFENEFYRVFEREMRWRASN
jgi:hypothetical protein